MSLRKLSGAAAAGSRESYATTSVAPTSSSTSAVAGTTTNTKNAYSSHLAIQSDAAKYRGKYKELKKKVRQIETENDRLHVKTLRIKRNIQRMRLERAILYERLEAELQDNGTTTQMTEKPKNAVEEKHQPVSTHAQTSTRNFDTPSPPEASVQARQEVAHSSGGRERRNLDYSPSPEEQIEYLSEGKAPSNSSSPVHFPENPPSPSPPPPITVKPEPSRSSMKITLKRHNNTANNGGK